ncbi:hypothetical protein HHK36_016432 [Tetracentron sinense]|uniref:VOC domain-containing protein n=1 Tax=Tetracentron sinense TaxID=13715 RepID=A0A834Z1B9_TETSI|nr:hypothetical protein HHK36_016432 [Tetracentron sinense]
MASSNLSPTFAYTVVYVKDVAKSVAFYANAFGYSVRRLDESHRWGELESGQTTIAFTPVQQHETLDITGPYRLRDQGARGLLLRSASLTKTLTLPIRAVENGAVPVSEPEAKEWGQKVGYLRDIDGVIVRMGSFVTPPSYHSHQQ